MDNVPARALRSLEKKNIVGQIYTIFIACESERGALIYKKKQRAERAINCE